jgi:type I restriction-modification system DNA methylase subunit
MNITQIENNLKLLIENIDKETFIYQLLESYYLPKASISRLQKGSLNMSKIPGEVSWKKKLFFKEELNNDVHITISSLKNEIKHSQRFIIVTDYKTLLAIDNLTQDQLDIPIAELPKYYDFFLPWAGMEKATHSAENPADVKAAEKMAKLFDEIKKDNPDTSKEAVHNLNIFFSRLLFCYFAEDTNIFEEQQFSHAVESHTKSDGSDLDTYLNRLFWVLNTPMDKRGDIPNYLNAFPYVNGGLFREEILTPKFSAKSRQILIDSGDNNDWSSINPDIFGSMFQAVISPEHRGGLGAHYTSVPNIMKVIEPLFLNELKEAFEDAIGNEKKLKELLHRISKIKLFDPACGSGNFLIIAYKELRRLEMQILKELGGFAFSGIHLNNFYGIELDDFAHEIAKLSLWLAEHQMNVEFFNEFGRTNPTLPLQEAGQIMCGNACRLDWEKVCPKNEGDEIYIMGNPPYLGTRNQDANQKKDMDIVFGSFSKRRKLDYISAWFFLASKFIESTYSKFAFVTTNSICQGEQVPILWPLILKETLNISFCFPSFNWSNNAKSNAGVTVAIIGVSDKKINRKKIIFKDNLEIYCEEINPYLVNAKTIYVQPKNHPISKLPDMIRGNYTGCCSSLILNQEEVNSLISEFPNSYKFIKKFQGSAEYINGIERFCLWVSDADIKEAESIPPIKKRFEIVREERLNSTDLGQQRIAERYHQFREFNETTTTSLLMPVVSSERRKYIPCGFINKDVIIPNSAQAVYNTEPFILSILMSTMHIAWIRILAGRLRSDIRYSSSICYNTFPFPSISNQRKEELTQCTFRILEEREKHPEKTLAQLYDPDKMPDGLKEAHRLNDEAVERCYRSTPFNSDEERLEYLFKLYEKMIQEEKEKGTLFAAEKKTRKKK